MQLQVKMLWGNVYFPTRSHPSKLKVIVTSLSNHVTIA